MAYIGRQLARGENKLFDDISSSFNGSTTVFNLTVSSVATSTATPYQLFVSLGGVMQKPNTDFTTAGNQITFTTAPAAGLSCWIMMQGDTIDNAAVGKRSERDELLKDSDWTQLADKGGLADSKVTEWATYRQSLRDLPTASGWPHTHTLPTKPS